MYRKYIKRILDIIFSLLGIIFLLPIYIIVSLLILITMGFPIFFKQKRPGKDEKIFTMYKFRTMNNKKDKDGNLLPDKDRLTKLGWLLRKTSLDELPEFFLILTGKMSLIGPRPLRIRYLPYYTDEERRRHNVRPGLTGYSQVNGRNNLQWEERFEYDLYYVDNMSLLLDIKILLQTIKKVLSKSDVHISGTTKIQDFDKYRQKQRKEQNNEFN